MSSLIYALRMAADSARSVVRVFFPFLSFFSGCFVSNLPSSPLPRALVWKWPFGYRTRSWCVQGRRLPRRHAPPAQGNGPTHRRRSEDDWNTDTSSRSRTCNQYEACHGRYASLTWLAFDCSPDCCTIDGKASMDDLQQALRMDFL